MHEDLTFIQKHMEGFQEFGGQERERAIVASEIVCCRVCNRDGRVGSASVREWREQ